jgi:hypothetical protein
MRSEFETHASFNIYDFLFAFNQQNDAEIYVILETVATSLDQPAGFTKSLGQAIATRSGSAIFDHGYSEFLLPTWATTPVDPNTKLRGPTDMKKFLMTLTSNRNRAHDLTFLQGAPPPATATSESPSLFLDADMAKPNPTKSRLEII